MSDTFNVNTVTADYAAMTGSTAKPLIWLPPDGGAVIITAAKVIGSAAGTSIGLKLIKMSSAGTPAASGTIGTAAGTVVYAAGVPASITVSTPVVDPSTTGCWLGVSQTGGTAPVNTILTLAYQMGR